MCVAHRLACEHDSELDPPLMHVPGLALVDEGIDGASLDGTHFGPEANLAHVLGPRVGDRLWASPSPSPSQGPGRPSSRS